MIQREAILRCWRRMDSAGRRRIRRAPVHSSSLLPLGGSCGAVSEMCVRGRSSRVRIQADDMADCEQRRKLIALASIVLILRVSEKRNAGKNDGEKKDTGTAPKRTHGWWVRPWILNKSLPECNTVYKLQLELEKCDRDEYRRMLRVDAPTFHYILDQIYHTIKKQNTPRRKSIKPDERLSLTLYYLATGATTVTLAQIYRLCVCSAGRIIKQVCHAIVWKLMKKYICLPQSHAGWMELVNGFDQRWHYPACVGALDGKHVRMRKPVKSGSYFFNYKGYFSIILMALVNSNYEFTYVDIGAEGGASDGGVWRQCSLYQELASGKVQLPPDVQLKGTNQEVSCHIVGDDAFQLSRTLMKPYSKENSPTMRLFTTIGVAGRGG